MVVFTLKCVCATMIAEGFQPQTCAGTRGVAEGSRILFHTGWSRSQKTVYKGERQSTARTYIKRARDRANLDILTRAHVQRVIFEGAPNVAISGTSGDHPEGAGNKRLKRVFVLFQARRPWGWSTSTTERRNRCARKER